jgi:hypothetical protein
MMKRGTLLLAVAATMACSAAQAANLLLNAGFNTPQAGLSPPNYPTSLSALSGPGVPSSAADWLIWNNTLTTTSTELLTSTDPAGAGLMAHVTSGAYENGLYQFVAADSVNFVSVDVYLLSGTFELGLGRNGSYEATAKTSTPDQWVHLTASIPTTIGDEIFLYSTNSAAAEFYVDNAYAGMVPAAMVPEDSTWAMMLAGFAALGFAGWRRSQEVAAR